MTETEEDPAPLLGVVGLFVAVVGSAIALAAGCLGWPVAVPVFGLVMCSGGIAVAAASAWIESRRSDESFGLLTWRAIRGATSLLWALVDPL